MRKALLRWSGRQSLLSGAVTALFALGLLLILSLQVNSSYRAEVQRARAEAQNLAGVLEGQLGSALREVDLVVNGLTQQLQPADLREQYLGEVRNKELQSLLLDQLAQIRQLDNLGLFSPGAVLTHRALDVPGSNIPLRAESLERLRNNPFVERDYIRLDGKDGLQRSGLIIVRRVETTPGQLDGWVGATLTTQYFDRVFGTLSLGQQGVAMLIDERLGIIASYPGKPAGFELDAATLRALRDGAQDGIQVRQTRGDGITRQTAYQQIGQSPFFVAVSLSSNDYLARWQTETRYYLIGGALLLVMALLMTYFFWQSRQLSAHLRHKEKRLDASESRFRQMIETTPVALVLSRPGDHFITYINQQAAQMFALPQAAALSMRVFQLYQDRLDFLNQIEDVRQGQPVRNLEVRLRRSNGETFWGHLSMSLAQGSAGTTLLIGISDITEHKALEIELQHRATTDGLSGLANRAHFMDVSNHELIRAQRYGRPLTLMMIDIDHFKRINDEYGHDAGDAAIRAIAALCRSTLRDADIIGRLGGEEFAALLPETPMPMAQLVAERLRARIESHELVIPSGETIRFTTSIGLTALAPCDTLIDPLLKRADLALYEAKHGGRNRVSQQLHSDALTP
ncbi:diguanylate cyclase [Jeongeupia naejangsanensis]|uniref:diguanylate cyclase n=1 Tax=Jeongeupia naejangsanensis TaxID=613195 RepID=A0ABS2BI40_9NEIS|nr:diguanylate cyclase [Jeongeupia naejangsanensis]MBM3115278.1 diguanylate cyclase [Jeongeupia naejangsanensis]